MERTCTAVVDKLIEWANGDAPVGAYELANEVLALRAEAEGHGHWALAMVDKCDALTVKLAKAEDNAAKNIDALRGELSRKELERWNFEQSARHRQNEADIFNKAHEAALLRIVELRQEVSKTEHSIEEALEARDKWVSIGHRQKAALEAVEKLLPQAFLTGEPHGDLVSAIMLVLRELRGDQ